RPQRMDERVSFQCFWAISLSLGPLFWQPRASSAAKATEVVLRRMRTTPLAHFLEGKKKRRGSPSAAAPADGRQAVLLVVIVVPGGLLNHVLGIAGGCGGGLGLSRLRVR